MAQRLVEIQRHFLELLGGLRWLMSIDDDSHANLSHVAVDTQLDVTDRLANWGLPQQGGRGVLVDLFRDWREINIPLYIDNRVPVHYIWTPDLQADPRFRSLSPTTLDTCCPTDAVAWAYHSNPAAITSHLADQFLQLRYPMDVPVVKIKAQSKMDNLVVDFEGWRAHPATKRQCHRYLKDLWYVEVPTRSASRRVFYRSRPRVNLYDAYNYVNAPAEESLTIIREIWKFSCCPPPHYRYAPPLATEREFIGNSTIPPDAPVSSLQPLPTPPVFSGNPYSDISDDDEFDDNPISMKSNPYTASLDRMDVDNEGMDNVRPTATTSSEQPRSPFSPSTVNQPCNGAPVPMQLCRHETYSCQLSTRTPRRGSSFAGDRAKTSRVSGQDSGWRGRSRDIPCRRDFVNPISQPTGSNIDWGSPISVDPSVPDLWGQALRESRAGWWSPTVETG